MKKKLLSLILSLAVVIGAAPVGVFTQTGTASAEETYELPALVSWSLYGEDDLHISDFTADKKWVESTEMGAAVKLTAKIRQDDMSENPAESATMVVTWTFTPWSGADSISYMEAFPYCDADGCVVSTFDLQKKGAAFVSGRYSCTAAVSENGTITKSTVYGFELIPANIVAKLSIITEKEVESGDEKTLTSSTVCYGFTSFNSLIATLKASGLSDADVMLYRDAICGNSVLVNATIDTNGFSIGSSNKPLRVSGKVTLKNLDSMVFVRLTDAIHSRVIVDEESCVQEPEGIVISMDNPDKFLDSYIAKGIGAENVAVDATGYTAYEDPYSGMLKLRKTLDNPYAIVRERSGDGEIKSLGFYASIKDAINAAYDLDTDENNLIADDGQTVYLMDYILIDGGKSPDSDAYIISETNYYNYNGAVTYYEPDEYGIGDDEDIIKLKTVARVTNGVNSSFYIYDGSETVCQYSNGADDIEYPQRTFKNVTVNARIAENASVDLGMVDIENTWKSIDTDTDGFSEGGGWFDNGEGFFVYGTDSVEDAEAYYRVSTQDGGIYITKPGAYELSGSGRVTVDVAAGTNGKYMLCGLADCGADININGNGRKNAQFDMFGSFGDISIDKARASIGADNTFEDDTVLGALSVSSGPGSYVSYVLTGNEELPVYADEIEVKDSILSANYTYIINKDFNEPLTAIYNDGGHINLFKSGIWLTSNKENSDVTGIRNEGGSLSVSASYLTIANPSDCKAYGIKNYGGTVIFEKSYINNPEGDAEYEEDMESVENPGELTPEEYDLSHNEIKMYHGVGIYAENAADVSDVTISDLKLSISKSGSKGVQIEDGRLFVKAGDSWYDGEHWQEYEACVDIDVDGAGSVALEIAPEDDAVWSIEGSKRAAYFSAETAIDACFTFDEEYTHNSISCGVFDGEVKIGEKTGAEAIAQVLVPVNFIITQDEQGRLIPENVEGEFITALVEGGEYKLKCNLYLNLFDNLINTYYGARHYGYGIDGAEGSLTQIILNDGKTHTLDMNGYSMVADYLVNFYYQTSAYGAFIYIGNDSVLKLINSANRATQLMCYCPLIVTLNGGSLIDGERGKPESAVGLYNEYGAVLNQTGGLCELSGGVHYGYFANGGGEMNVYDGIYNTFISLKNAEGTALNIFGGKITGAKCKIGTKGFDDNGEFVDVNKFLAIYMLDVYDYESPRTVYAQDKNDKNSVIPFEKTLKLYDHTGTELAEEEYGSHLLDGYFEKENIGKLYTVSMDKKGVDGYWYPAYFAVEDKTQGDEGDDDDDEGGGTGGGNHSGSKHSGNGNSGNSGNPAAATETAGTSEEATAAADYADCAKDGACPLAKYADLYKDEWYHDGIHYSIEKGLMNGYDYGLFGPNDRLTRAQLVTMLWRLEGQPAVKYAMDFSDVPASAWFAEQIRWAASAGLVTGYEKGRFAPDDELTREQLTTIMYRYAKYKNAAENADKSVNLLTYTDSSEITPYAVTAMQWAVDTGIITGIYSFADGKTYLEPLEAATRAQIANIMLRWCEQ